MQSQTMKPLSNCLLVFSSRRTSSKIIQNYQNLTFARRNPWSSSTHHFPWQKPWFWGTNHAVLHPKPPSGARSPDDGDCCLRARALHIFQKNPPMLAEFGLICTQSARTEGAKAWYFSSEGCEYEQICSTGTVSAKGNFRTEQAAKKCTARVCGNLHILHIGPASSKVAISIRLGCNISTWGQQGPNSGPTCRNLAPNPKLDPFGSNFGPS